MEIIDPGHTYRLSVLDGKEPVDAVELLTGGEKLVLIHWLEERRSNCARIAKTKTGHDKRGWNEDESYFALAIRAIKATL